MYLHSGWRRQHTAQRLVLPGEEEGSDMARRASILPALFVFTVVLSLLLPGMASAAVAGDGAASGISFKTPVPASPAPTDAATFTPAPAQPTSTPSEITTPVPPTATPTHTRAPATSTPIPPTATPTHTQPPATSTPMPAFCTGVSASARLPITGLPVSVQGSATSGTGPNAIVAYAFDFGDESGTGWQGVGGWSGGAGASTVYEREGSFTIMFFIRLASGQVLGGGACSTSIAIGAGAPPETPPARPGQRTSTPTATPVPDDTPTPVNTPTPTPTETPSPTPTQTPEPTPTVTGTLVPTPPATGTPVPTPSLGETPSVTPMPTGTATRAPDQPAAATRTAMASPMVALTGTPLPALTSTPLLPPVIGVTIAPPTAQAVAQATAAIPAVEPVTATTEPTHRAAPPQGPPDIVISELFFAGPADGPPNVPGAPAGSSAPGAQAPSSGVSLAAFTTSAERDPLLSSQWIEIFNRSAVPYIMVGWQLQTASGNFDIADVTIGGRDYAILTWNSEYFRQTYPDVPSPIIELGESNAGAVGLGPSFDHAVLRDPDGNALNGASYGVDATVFDPPAPAVPHGHSLERTPPDRVAAGAADFVDRYPPDPGGPPAPLMAPTPRRVPLQDVTRDAFFAPIPTTAAILHTPVDVIVANLLLVALLALVFGACGMVLDDLVRSQETTMSDMVMSVPLLNVTFRALERMFGSARNAQHKNPALRIGAAMVAYALLMCLLDPGWHPLGPGGLYLFVVMMGAVLIAGWSDGVGQFMALRHWRVPSQFNFWPANLLAGGASVLTSRILPLQPGMLFGAPGGLNFDAELVQGQRAERLRWVGIISMVTLVLGSWGLSTGFDALSVWLNGNATTVTLPATIAVGLRNFCLAGFLAVLQSFFFQLIPISSTYGRFMWSRKPWLWLAVFIPTAAVLSRILINPHEGPLTAWQQRPVQILLVILLGYVIFTALMWFYFNRHEAILRATGYRERHTAAARVKPEGEEQQNDA